MFPVYQKVVFLQLGSVYRLLDIIGAWNQDNTTDARQLNIGG